jgi:hypothetical protein
MRHPKHGLERFSTQFGESHGFGEVIESSSGPCKFGTMGWAVFRSTECPRIQIWHLSNGRDFIMVTHIWPTVPDPVEVCDAQVIVRAITVGKKSSWRFW